MSRYSKSERELDRYIFEAAEAMLAALPEPEDCEEPRTSPQYKAKMSRLFKKTERRERFRSYSRRAAAVLLAFVLGSGTFLGINSEARADFGAWLKAEYQGSIFYRYMCGDTNTPMPEIEFGWLPEGYELTLKDELENSLTYIYENGDNGFIFSCDRMTENNLTQFFPKETDICREVSVNGAEAEMWISENGNSRIIWKEDNSNFIYSVDGNLNECDILHIAEEIKTAN